MPTVELVYDRDCPNVTHARAQLMRAFARTKTVARWQEWRGDDPESPPHVRGFGSPTILVDGEDVAPVVGGDGAACRLYTGEDGALEGVPSIEAISSALTLATSVGASQGTSGRGGWKLNLALIPGIGAAFLPKIACPACWPAYAGLLSSVGLGFLLDTTYLLPLTATFLAIAVGALAFRAQRRLGYLPFLLGLVASAVVLVGKFAFESDPAMYVGLALLIGASIWNSWPRRIAPSEACPACAGNEQHTAGQAAR